MRRVIIELPGLVLLGSNDLLGINRHVYRLYRAGICEAVAAVLPRRLRPDPPIRHYRLRVTLTLPKPFDGDGKFAALKPLIDVLCRLHPSRNPHGLDILYDDQDGEHGLAGNIRGLQVVQRVGKPHVRVDIREVRP